jgi:hypothetical protein
MVEHAILDPKMHLLAAKPAPYGLAALTDGIAALPRARHSSRWVETFLRRGKKTFILLRFIEWF